MSTRRRLRSSLETRNASNVCWSCAARLLRYHSEAQEREIVNNALPIYVSGGVQAARKRTLVERGPAEGSALAGDGRAEGRKFYENRWTDGIAIQNFPQNPTEHGLEQIKLEKRVSENAPLPSFLKNLTLHNESRKASHPTNNERTNFASIRDNREQSNLSGKLKGNFGRNTNQSDLSLEKKYKVHMDQDIQKAAAGSHSSSRDRRRARFSSFKYRKCKSDVSSQEIKVKYGFVLEYGVLGYSKQEHGKNEETGTESEIRDHPFRRSPPMHKILYKHHRVLVDGRTQGDKNLDSVLATWTDMQESRRFNSHLKDRRDVRKLSSYHRLNQGYRNTSTEQNSKFIEWPQRRNYATTTFEHNRSGAHIDPAGQEMYANPPSLEASGGIREHLRLWQKQHDLEHKTHAANDLAVDSRSGTNQNCITQSGEDESSNVTVLEEGEAENDEYLQLGPDESTLDVISSRIFFRRGDIVELRTPTDGFLAVFVRNVTNQSQFYTIRGEWLYKRPANVRFKASGFIDPKDVDEVLPYLPGDKFEASILNRLQPLVSHAPRDAGAKIIEKLTSFQQATDSVFRTHANRINRSYEIIAPVAAAIGRTRQSLREITMKVLQTNDAVQLTPPMLFAVHRALCVSDNVVWDYRTFRDDPVYEIYPQENLQHIYKVREWMRDYQEGITEKTNGFLELGLGPAIGTRPDNPIARFTLKARAAIARSREKRSLSVNGSIGPSVIKPVPEEPTMQICKEIKLEDFDKDERTIVHFLDAWVTSAYINNRSPLGSIGPLILRAIGMYDGFALERRVGLTLLQELGIVTPWENRTTQIVRAMRLPGHDTISEEITRLHNKAKTSLENFALKDTMEGLRKDWRELPVFCIDGAETLERDDGVSIERVAGSSSEFWIHVHVANPTAFINPGSAFERYAAQLTESVYFPECKYPMLDSSLTSEYFSLERDRPCLTFSARINTEGDILEKKIVPGIVRNVRHLTPSAISRELGLTNSKDADTTPLLVVGGQIPTVARSLRGESEALPPSHVEMLQLLLDIGKATRQKRIRHGALEVSPSRTFNAIRPRVYLGKTEISPFHINYRNMRTFEGDPIIALEKIAEHPQVANSMISDLMLLAGQIAALWCSERNIPIPYRGVLRNPEPASPPEEYKRNILDPKIAKSDVPVIDLLQYMQRLGKTFVSASPMEHSVIGLPAYCKASSPLRRYGDMYVHWQIEAAIRHEAETGISLVGSRDESYLPFPRRDAEQLASTLLDSEGKVRYVKNSASGHWTTYALFRAFYFNEAPLPKTFEVTVGVGPTKSGFIQAYGLWIKFQSEYCEVVHREKGLFTGDVWEARIKEIDVYLSTIYMEPLRLIRRTATVPA